MTQIDYGGVSSLAQAVLAINIAYIGLDRFRYKAEVEKLYRSACEQVKEMPSDFKNDLAWINISNISSGGIRKAWGDKIFGYFLYRYLFVFPTDVITCALFSISSIFLLTVHAYDALIRDMNMTASLAAQINLSDLTVNWLILAMLLLGIAMPVAFLAAGRYATRRAKEAMDGNLDHLGSRIKMDAKEAVQATSLDLAAKLP